MAGVVGIVGAGTMGAGIAQVALEAGHEVVLHDVDEAAVERGRDRIREGLARRAARLDLDADSIDDWVTGRLERLRRALTLDAVAGEAGVVVEAAIEDLELKRTIFLALDRDAPPDTVLATNTSALSIDAIARDVRLPGRVLGLHFFNPAPVLPLVEVVAGPQTDPGVAAGAKALVEGWGKTAIPCADVPGFIVNRVNRPFTLEALALLEAGLGDVAAIDAAVRAAGYPMGPFELMDLTGIDVTLATTRAIHAGFAERGDRLADRFRPSPLQEQLVAEGRLGRKTGRGWYDDPGGPRAILPGAAPPDDAAVVVERIEVAIALEAWRALEDRVADADEIDLALRLGAGHPAGPFERWSARGGPNTLLERLRALDPRGPRWVPPDGLVRRAAGRG